MDPITIITVAMPIIESLWAEAKKLGLVGASDWEAYADSGLHVLQNAVEIAAKIKSGDVKYDNLTANEIEALLTPDDWTASTVRRLADEKAAKEAGGG